MTEPTSSTAGGLFLWKFFGGLAVAGILASALGFMVMWPKTAKEAAVRLIATMTGSTLLGPLVCVAAYYQFPGIFAAAMKFAADVGLEPWAGIFMVGAPLCAFSGLPFWWLLGAFILYLEKRRGKDIGELVNDMRTDAKAML